MADLDSLQEQLEQLRADNEQLRADNEQLRADNEQLRADNEQLHADNERLRADCHKAQERIAELERRLGKHSRNSHKPPSSDPPWKERPSKAQGGKSGRKGRKGHRRERLEPTRVHDLYPSHCRRCGAPLEPEAVVGKPWVHQVTDIAGAGHEVDEYRRHPLRCPACRRTTRAELPNEVPSSAFGPRLQATAVTLIAAYRLSRRQTLGALEEFWGVRMSLGALHRCEQQLSESAARPVAAVRRRLRRQSALYVDETGWRRGAQRPWLWTASTPELASFWIASDRKNHTARRILKGYEGIVCTDDYSAYGWLPLEQRQMCWAHRVRDLQALSEYPHKPAYARTGQVMLRIARHLFYALHRVRDGTLPRDRFVERAHRLRRRFERICQWASHIRHSRAKDQKFSGLLRKAEALWRFVDHPEVEPTNNCAERALRHAVIWRRIRYGHRSRAGKLFVERMLTVVQTLRNQGRNVFQWLLAAASPTTPTPTLLPTR